MVGAKVNKRDTHAQRAEAFDLALILNKQASGSRRGLSALRFETLLTMNGAVVRALIVDARTLEGVVVRQAHHERLRVRWFDRSVLSLTKGSPRTVKNAAVRQTLPEPDEDLTTNVCRELWFGRPVADLPNCFLRKQPQTIQQIRARNTSDIPADASPRGIW